jgi:cytochrome bd-type quinol oxidase subunit 1
MGSFVMVGGASWYFLKGATRVWRASRCACVPALAGRILAFHGDRHATQVAHRHAKFAAMEGVLDRKGAPLISSRFPDGEGSPSPRL